MGVFDQRLGVKVDSFVRGPVGRADQDTAKSVITLGHLKVVCILKVLRQKHDGHVAKSRLISDSGENGNIHVGHEDVDDTSEVVSTGGPILDVHGHCLFSG
ncbi:hypothetical protein [Kushneria sp. TE3]|uniref:hypothetical protein n=1 Tax=Kushneria sp. TE3 TaxID=3449832 RepID=UPI003F685694